MSWIVSFPGDRGTSVSVVSEVGGNAWSLIRMAEAGLTMKRGPKRRRSLPISEIELRLSGVDRVAVRVGARGRRSALDRPSATASDGSSG